MGQAEGKGLHVEGREEPEWMKGAPSEAVREGAVDWAKEQPGDAEWGKLGWAWEVSPSEVAQGKGKKVTGALPLTEGNREEGQGEPVDRWLDGGLLRRRHRR